MQQFAIDLSQALLQVLTNNSKVQGAQGVG